MTQTTADPIAGTARSADGTTIAYDRFDAATARSPGDGGPPVVMVHAAGGYRDFASMRSLAEVLAAEIPVVTYDRRGRGAERRVARRRRRRPRRRPDRLLHRRRTKKSLGMPG
jgi:pimeloyl-ACP methyl ester carboxylesterase